MIDTKYNYNRLNLLYEFAYKQLGLRDRFGTDVIGETPEERRSNTLFLYKFILRDVLKLTKEEALLKETELGLDNCGKMYVYLLTPQSYEAVDEEERFFYPQINGFVIEIIYNDWDCDEDVLAIYKWLDDYIKADNKKKQLVSNNRKFFESIIERHELPVIESRLRDCESCITGNVRNEIFC